MKAAAILLAILAISFAAVVGWVASRGDDAGGGGWFGKPPPIGVDGEPDEDTLADWDVPPVGALLAPVLAPLARPIAVSNRVVALRPQEEVRVTVGRSDQDFQAARLALASGSAARVSADPDDDPPDDATACLCRARALVSPGFFADCGRRWKDDRRTADGRYLCLEGDDTATLVFGRGGGSLVFAADTTSARVTIR